PGIAKTHARLCNYVEIGGVCRRGAAIAEHGQLIDAEVVQDDEQDVGQVSIGVGRAGMRAAVAAGEQGGRGQTGEQGTTLCRHRSSLMDMEGCSWKHRNVHGAIIPAFFRFQEVVARAARQRETVLQRMSWLISMMGSMTASTITSTMPPMIRVMAGSSSAVRVSARRSSSLDRVRAARSSMAGSSPVRSPLPIMWMSRGGKTCWACSAAARALPSRTRLIASFDAARSRSLLKVRCAASRAGSSDTPLLVSIARVAA